MFKPTMTEKPPRRPVQISRPRASPHPLYPPPAPIGNAESKYGDDGAACHAQRPVPAGANPRDASTRARSVSAHRARPHHGGRPSPEASFFPVRFFHPAFRDLRQPAILAPRARLGSGLIA